MTGMDFSGGLVMGTIIGPKDGGRFPGTSGAPVCVNLRTHPAKVEAGKVLIAIEG